VSIYASALALYGLGEFLWARGLRARLGWAVQVLVFLAHPIVFGSRAAVGLFGIVALFGLGAVLPSRAAKYASLLSALAMLGLGIQANLFAPVAEITSRVQATSAVVPSDVLQDPSFQGRVEQVREAVKAVQEYPVLGMGLGSTLTFFHPGLNEYQSEAIVDQGYAYLLSKFGLVGVVVFAWLMVSVARKSGWPGRQGTHLGLLLVFTFHVSYLMNGPIFFHFLYAAWVGTTCGFLCLMRSLRPNRAAQRPRQMTPGLAVNHQW